MRKEEGCTAMATKVNTAALIRPVLSVLKFNNPIARPPRTTVNCSHERNVRSFAKKTKRQTSVSCYCDFQASGGATFWFDADGKCDSGA